jgi:hypothetical protein
MSGARAAIEAGELDSFIEQAKLGWRRGENEGA